MSYPRNLKIGIVLTFSILFFYFFFTYKYYPGIKLQISGNIEDSLRGTISWNFGKGFNDLDSVSVDLLPQIDDSKIKLGTITLMPAGFKNAKSRGYITWIILPKDAYDSKAYKLTGKHHWGNWMHITTKKQGRQLALFPGTTLSFPSNNKKVKIYLFKTPSSGFIKITSENGPKRFYDCYDVNKKLQITPSTYTHKTKGQIQVIAPTLNGKKWQHINLPHQKLESIKFDFSNQKLTDITPLEKLRITLPGNAKIGKDNRPESNHPAWIERVIINGKTLDFNSPTVTFSGAQNAQGFRLITRKDYLEIKETIFSYEIIFAKSSPSLSITIAENENLVRIVEGQREFKHVRITNTAPSILQKNVLTTATLTDWKGQQHSFDITKSLNKPEAFDIQDIPQQKEHLFLILFQLFLALVLSLVINFVTKEIHHRAKAQHNSLFHYIFFQHKRYIFWLFFFIGIAINFLYLAADWPGSMTPDSIFIHKELKKLAITNHHPYIYSLYVLALHNIFDHPVSVALFQICSFHFVAGLFFYLLHRKGASLLILVPLYCLIPLSIPVNLLNITLWKDIPYSLIVLGWACILVYLFYKRLYESKIKYFSLPTTLLLSLLFLFLCTLRHNGLVYAPFIPLALGIICRVSVRWLFKFCSISALLFVGYYLLLPPLILEQKARYNNYAQRVTKKRFAELTAIKDTKEAYYLEHYLGNRTKKFTATLGTSSQASTWYNDMHSPPQRWFSFDEARSDMKTEPLFSWLEKPFKKILKTRGFSGYTSGRFIYWNSLFGLVGLILAALLYKWLPLSAFYSSFFLYQALAMYFIVWERWRYLYFIYLGGLFLLPVIALEINKLRQNTALLKKKDPA